MSDHHEPPDEVRLAILLELHDQNGQPQAPQDHSKAIIKEVTPLW